MSLRSKIERHFAAGAAAVGDAAALDAFLELRAALEAGAMRSAEPDQDAATGWRVNAWVKQGILLGFRLGQLAGSGACDREQADNASASARGTAPEQSSPSGF